MVELTAETGMPFVDFPIHVLQYFMAVARARILDASGNGLMPEICLSGLAI
jgi:hypothetical protein